ncbi:MAG: hypothetical protein IJQ58_07855 [Synergistaceae bacterium]|nr:hypothetical protein [Synergistaceae bacterium]
MAWHDGMRHLRRNKSRARMSGIIFCPAQWVHMQALMFPEILQTWQRPRAKLYGQHDGMRH